MYLLLIFMLCLFQIALYAEFVTYGRVNIATSDELLALSAAGSNESQGELSFVPVAAENVT